MQDLNVDLNLFLLILSVPLLCMSLYYGPLLRGIVKRSPLIAQ